MRLLLDTHALLWWLGDETRLASHAREAIVRGENAVIASVASIWEVAIKRATGRLQIEADLPDSVVASGLELLQITAEHAWAAGALPRHHSDPFDRMLVAQAQLEGLTIVTRDARIARYQVAVLPA